MPHFHDNYPNEQAQARKQYTLKGFSAHSGLDIQASAGCKTQLADNSIGPNATDRFDADCADEPSPIEEILGRSSEWKMAWFALCERTHFRSPHERELLFLSAASCS